MDTANDDVRGEKRWPMAVTLIVAMALPFLLPPGTARPKWIIPAVEAVFLVRSSSPIRDESTVGRPSFGLSRSGWSPSWSLGRRSHRPPGDRSGERRAGDELAGRAAPDRRGGVGLRRHHLRLPLLGARRRRSRGPGTVDARVPGPGISQHLNPQRGWSRLAPRVFDYLYLGFTDSTAFSPTDVMPLARWAKLAMAIQATSSLVILGLVIARAVNIFK